MSVNTDISCTLPRPDIAELSEEVRTELSKRLLGGAPVLPLSSEDVLAFVMAGTVSLMYGFVIQSLKENDPATMCCDNLVHYGAVHGIDLRAATRAKGYVAVSGTPDAVIPATMRFVGEASREYKLDPGVTFNPGRLDSTGRAVLRVVSTAAGEQMNVEAGSTLTVATTVTGIDMAATVVGSGIIGGTSDEDCEALRARVIEAERSGIIVVNQAWYLSETMKYPGVTRACTDECEDCCDPTFIAIYPFMEGVYGDVTTSPYGVPPCEVLDEMSEWMFGKESGRGQGLAPVGQRGGYHTAYPTVVNITGYCFHGCPTGAQAIIVEALWTYIRGSFCVGSKICKDQMRAAVYAALGPEPCFSRIELSFDESLGREDAAYAYLDCAHFLVLGTVTLLEDYG